MIKDFTSDNNMQKEMKEVEKANFPAVVKVSRKCYAVISHVSTGSPMRYSNVIEYGGTTVHS